MHCSAGRECFVTESGAPKCRCIEDCGVEADPRRQVCTNLNETFASDCEMHRMRCFCEEGNNDVCNPAYVEKYKHIHVEYYGERKKMRI